MEKSKRQKNGKKDADKRLEFGSGRRSFLKKSAATAGLTTVGMSSLTSLVKACDSPEGNYTEKDYTHWMKDEAQVKDSKCSNNFNSGTRIDSGGSLLYWNSADHGDGTYTHHFSTQTHGEHFDEDSSTCDWYHSLGLKKQRWRARDEVSGNVVSSDNPEWSGAFPAVSGSDDFTLPDIAFTGIGLLLAHAWPATSPIVTAAEIVYGMSQDRNKQSVNNWDEKIVWDYGEEHKDCLSHFVKFNSQATEPEADIYTEEGYWSDYLYTEISHHDSIGNPNWASSSSSMETSGDDGITAPRKDIQVGDVIQPENNRSVRVESIQTHTTHQQGGPKVKVNEEEYKRMYPADYEEHGAPEYLLRLPATSTTTTLTGIVLD